MYKMKPGSKNITTEGNFNKKTDSLVSQFKNAVPKNPDTFTRNYNAATGMTHEFMREPGSGKLFTPGYDFKKANIYKANAIKQHGSLKASREYYNKIRKKNK